MRDTSRAGRAALLLVGSVLVAPVRADPADAFPTPAEAAEANERTIGIQLPRDARRLDLVEDIERSLALAAGLRLVPMIAADDVRAVYDLLHLDGTDLAVVRADAVEYVRRESGLGGARRLLLSLARLGEERIAVVAHASVDALDALAGLPVALGRAGSAESVTGTLLFDALGVDVEPVEGAGADALGRVRSGELAAMVHLLDGPDPFGPEEGSGADGPAGGARVLPLPGDARLGALYRPSTLDATDLPGLVPAGESVPTWAVDVSLVAYAWSPGHARASRMERFVEALVDRAEELGDDDSEPEWQDVALGAEVPNLAGSPAVREALERRAAALARLREEERPVTRIPETLARVPAVRTVRDAEAVGLSGGETLETWMDDLFGGLEALLTPPAAAPSPVDGEADAGAAGGPDPAQPQNSTTSW